MAEQGRTTLKGYFETGDTPTQAQFEDLIDSNYNLTDNDSDAITEGATNLFLTSAERSKLSGVEAGADVTDTANVTAAGALMDSEITNLAQVKAFDSSDYATAAQGATADSALQDVVDDTTPQLGGDLDVNGNNITGNPAIDGRRAIVTEATTEKILALTDAGNFIVTTSDSGTEITIPTNESVAFPNGTEIDFIQKGAGQLTIVCDEGVTLNGVSAGSTAITAQWGGATIKKIDTDEWVIVGKINDVA